MAAAEDILQWASKLSPWRQDALRRLATSSVLTSQDHDELLAAIQESVGFSVTPMPPALSPLTKAHFSGVTTGAPLKLQAIQNVENVNRLAPSASLAFAPEGLTIIYGRNGSGKSGFVRILRSACRTRIENAAKLKVLANVYGSNGGLQKADIVIDAGNGSIIVPWTAGAPASESLLQVAVFDSGAAQLYVDGGNQIQFLPFGLALPHKLNELCLNLKTTLEHQRTAITDQIALAVVTFELPRNTKAQVFYLNVGAHTLDNDILAKASFSDAEEARLNEIRSLLGANDASGADLKGLATWVQTLAIDLEAFAHRLSDSRLEEYEALVKAASATRLSASLGADDLFSNEPLTGVGTETWRTLWLAARDFSVAEAYPTKNFPVTIEAEPDAKCILCQQLLTTEASDRFKRFQGFVLGSLAGAADRAEEAVADAFEALPDLSSLHAKDWPDRIDQIKKRNGPLSSALEALKSNLAQRLVTANEILTDPKWSFDAPHFALMSPLVALEEFSAALLKEADALATAGVGIEREKLVAEEAELVDQKLLSARRAIVTVRRDLLKKDTLYAAALAEVQTKGITQKANELVDIYLTTAVADQFANECQGLEIGHLKIGLARKSGQTKASFQTDPGTKLTKAASDILSEGEQRALALATFLTEIAVTEGMGPIVIDDPVSSLDRQRGLKVAGRLVEEALKRQVIVFTHDLIFFNDLCRETNEQGAKSETIALFSDIDTTGNIDSAGVSWKGLAVNKRLAKIKNDFSPLRKLHAKTPSDYEFAVKHLYGRLRDTYERVVEEFIFCDVVRRGVDRVETQRLRMVHLSDALAIRFHEGMTKANTYSHDNPAADNISVPSPTEFDEDITFIESLVADLKAESLTAEASRPTMKVKN